MSKPLLNKPKSVKVYICGIMMTGSWPKGICLLHFDLDPVTFRAKALSGHDHVGTVSLNP